MKLTPEQILQLEEETVLLCQEMIRIPSVNYGEGKGDEKAMAEYVAAKLSEVGIKSELIETAPNRVNVVAHIEGRDRNRPGLVLHGHIDVVPVCWYFSLMKKQDQIMVLAGWLNIGRNYLKDIAKQSQR